MQKQSFVGKSSLIEQNHIRFETTVCLRAEGERAAQTPFPIVGEDPGLFFFSVRLTLKTSDNFILNTGELVDGSVRIDQTPFDRRLEGQ